MKLFFKPLLFTACLLFFASCVTNKQIQYLQKADVNKKKEELPKDTVVRDYTSAGFNYKVQANDILYIRFSSITPQEFDFFNNSEAGAMKTVTNINATSVQLFGDLVDADGEIPFPVVGRVKVAGLTIFEIQDKLQELANNYLESPIVKVRLVNYRVTILGEVNLESSITLANNRVSLIEAIGLVGGLTDLADRSNIKVIRQKGQVSEVQYVDLLDEKFVTSPYYYVNQNDVVIVPPLKQRAFRKYFGQNLTLVVSSITLLLLTYNFINNN